MQKKRTTAPRKPRAEYLRDKIAYHEQKLKWEYDQLALVDPSFRPNFIPANQDEWGSPEEFDAWAAGGETVAELALSFMEDEEHAACWCMFYTRDYQHRSADEREFKEWIDKGRPQLSTMFDIDQKIRARRDHEQWRREKAKELRELLEHRPKP